MTTFKQMNRRQQIMTVLTALFFLIAVWQLYALFKTPTTASNTAPVNKPVRPNPQINRQVNSKPVQTAPTVVPSAVANNQNQSEYLRLVSEYQLLQIQRMIAENYQAIAVAKLSTVKAQAEISRLGGDPGNAAQNNMTNIQNSTSYELVYTGKQGNQWTATLKKANQTYDIVPGTVLDGTMRVTSIDDNGVMVLSKDGKKKMITFNGEVAIDENTADSGQVANNPVITTEKLLPKQAPVVAVPPASVTTVKALPEATKKVVVATPSKSVVTISATKPAMLPVPELLSKPMVQRKPAVVVQSTKTASIKQERYTLQLATFHTPEDATKFIQLQKLQGKANTLHTMVGDRDQFLVVSGDYATMTDAEKNLRLLPDKLQTNTPIIKRLDHLIKIDQDLATKAK